MSNYILHLVINDGLWLLIAVGWVILIATGLEADKSLSGGIPGHVSPADTDKEAEGIFGRLGEIGAWVVFGLAACSLPLLLWWVVASHPH